MGEPAPEIPRQVVEGRATGGLPARTKEALVREVDDGSGRPG